MTIGGWELNSAAFEEILDINFYDANNWIDHINISQIQYQIWGKACKMYVRPTVSASFSRGDTQPAHAGGGFKQL